MLNIKIYNIFLLLILVFPITSYGLEFELPKQGNSLVGEPQTAQVLSDEDDFSSIAEKFDVGYYEMYEANPGVNPDNPEVGSILIVPTQYVLPQELKENTIIINLAEMRLYYLPKDKNKIYIFPVGIGKEDWETPTGAMTIVKKTKDPKWIVPNSIYKFRKSIGDKIDRVIPAGPDNPLGHYALRLSKRGYLIHGTNLAAGVGRRSSAGCIRLYEKDIEQLYNLVDIGTRVVIIDKPYKAGWFDKKLYLEAHMPLFEQRIETDDDIKPVFSVIDQTIKNHKIMVHWINVAKIAREHLVIPRAVS